jgi:peptidyl-prolyl cis-trans isomerase C
VTRGKTDPAFEQAAFALKNPGDLSEPVLSRYGYHIIKLEARKPARQRTFDEAKREILAEMKQKYVAEAREAAVRGIRSDTRIQVDQDAVEALVVQIEVPPTPVAPTLPTTAPPRRRAPGQ